MMDEMDFISVKEIMETLKVSKATAYRLLKTPGCPCIQIGARYIVERRKFFDWLSGYEGKQIILTS